MANITISGKLTIPNEEVSSGGIYTDLELLLVGINEGIESTIEIKSVNTSKRYSFNYDDALVEKVYVRLRRISTGAILAESVSRGVLPRSFKLLPTDAQYNTDFKNNNFLYDAGLAIIATASAGKITLCNEIVNGVLLSDTLIGSLPFQINHVTPNPDVAIQEIRNNTVAMVAYSLGYYLERNPTSIYKAQAIDTLNKLLVYLNSQRTGAGNLIIGGKGRYSGASFNSDTVDGNVYTIDNILAYFAYKQAGCLFNNTYKDIANELSTAINVRLWDNVNGRFYHSLLPDNSKNNLNNLTINLFGALYYKEIGDNAKALSLYHRVNDSFLHFDANIGVIGYKANTGDSKVWFEGSYGVAALVYKLGNTIEYERLVKSLQKYLNDDGSFRWGVIKDGLNAVLDYKSVGSTAWAYIANKVPDEVFTINADMVPIEGGDSIYLNELQSQVFYKNDCSDETLPIPITYLIPAGRYTSTVSQEEANDLALDDIAENGQIWANVNGSCTVAYTYYNTERKKLFKKNNCVSPLTGSIVEYKVHAYAYGSDISQAHADAQADAKLFTDGQAFANVNGTCQSNTHIVNISSEIIDLEDFDGYSYYGKFKLTEAAETSLTVTYEYSTDNGINWLSPDNPQTILQGATQSSDFFISFWIYGFPEQNVVIRILNVTPNAFGSQVYNWNNNVPMFGNVDRSAYFIKNCPNGIDANSVVLYTISANTYTTHVSQEAANQLADNQLKNNGQAYANGNGVCPNMIYYNLIEQSLITKNDCPSGYTGSDVLYIVPANTYSSNISQEHAQSLAVQDVFLNGQGYANTNGTCTFNPGVGFVSVWLTMRVENYGLYDKVFVTAHSSEVINTGALYIVGTVVDSGNVSLGELMNLTIPNNSDVSHEVESMATYAPSSTVNLYPSVQSITPLSANGKEIIY